MRTVVFEGDSLEVIRSFPELARRRCGHEIDRLQRELKPVHWKPLPAVGMRAGEIKVRLDKQYRVVYVLGRKSTLYILHAFTKKTRTTPATDIETARRRLKDIVRREG